MKNASSLVKAILLFTAFVLTLSPRLAVAWLELYPADRTETVLFGWSIALSDDTAVVGSPRGSGDNGSVYVYSRTEEGWVFHQRLFPGDAHGGAYLFLGFGAGLAISGNTLAVAAPNRISPGGLGAVYIFERQDGQWTEQALITSTDGRPFGLSVALDRNTLVVGGREGRGDALVEAGLAYVFERAGHRWIQQAKLTSSDIPMFNRDGVSVAIDGKTIAVGQTSSHTLPGSVYLFTRKGRDWTQQAQITTPDGLRSFGDSVSLCGETLAVGAPMDGGGSVFIYERVAGAWLMQFGTYSASSVPYGSGSRLGETVVLNKGPNGLELLATAPYQNLARFRYDGSRPGAAWVYPRGPEGWGFAYRLVVPGAMVSPYAYDQDLFGKGAALNGHTVLIGAPLHGDQNSGVAYIIER